MMADESYQRQRHHLNEAISELPAMEDILPDEAYLTGWVMVAEFVDAKGGRWFCTRRGTDGGERDLMPWAEKGLLHELLESHTVREVGDRVGREMDQRWPEEEDDCDDD
jgi:hypothetical protein